MSDSSRTYRDEGIVLRTHKLGEADRICTILTKNHALVRAVAKGVRRTSSKFGSRLESFTVVDVLIHKGRSLDVITQVETIATYGSALSSDYQLYTSATVMVELTQRLAEEQETLGTAPYALLRGALRALAARERDPNLIVGSYLLRAMAQGGWAPSCSDCAVCGAKGPHQYFSIPAGGALCENCHLGGALRPGPVVMELLGVLLSGQWDQVNADGPARQRALEVAAAYAQWHLERRLKSVPIFQRGVEK